MASQGAMVSTTVPLLQRYAVQKNSRGSDEPRYASCMESVGDEEGDQTFGVGEGTVVADHPIVGTPVQ